MPLPKIVETEIFSVDKGITKISGIIAMMWKKEREYVKVKIKQKSYRNNLHQIKDFYRAEDWIRKILSNEKKIILRHTFRNWDTQLVNYYNN